jgi:segregation and condensation protein B
VSEEKKPGTNGVTEAPVEVSATERPPPDPSETSEYGALDADGEPIDGTLRGMRAADIVEQDPEATVNLTGDPEATVNLVGEPRDFPVRDDLPPQEEAELLAEAEQELEAESPTDEMDEAPTPLDADDVARTHLRGLLEALIFASDAPIKATELAKSASAPLKEVKQLLADLKGEYASRGMQLDEVAGGWIFRTSAAYAPFVRDLTKQKPVKLTRAQIETLAILAYRQPITRPEIDEIRGVDSGPVLKLLLERDLVKILGKKDEPGRPLLYGTTATFLEFFGLKSLKDLPTLREFTELNEDSRRVVEKELGETLETAQEATDRATEIDAPRAAAGEDGGEEGGEPLEGAVDDTMRPARLDEAETHVDSGSAPLLGEESGAPTEEIPASTGALPASDDEGDEGDDADEDDESDEDDGENDGDKKDDDDA